MHQRRVGTARLQHVDDGIELFVVHDHLGGDILRLRARGGDADGDRLAHVADLVECQDGLGRMLESAERGRCPDRLDVGHVAGGENGALVRTGDMHVADPPVCNRAAYEDDFTRAGNTEVRDILAAPAQKPIVLLARQPTPRPRAPTCLNSGLRCTTTRRRSTGSAGSPASRPMGRRRRMLKQGACKEPQWSSS